MNRTVCCSLQKQKKTELQVLGLTCCRTCNTLVIYIPEGIEYDWLHALLSYDYAETQVLALHGMSIPVCVSGSQVHSMGVGYVHSAEFFLSFAQHSHSE